MEARTDDLSLYHLHQGKRMKLEKQVCSLELAKRLKKLGVKQEKEAIFFWVKALYIDGRIEWQLWNKWEIEFEGDMNLDEEQEWCRAFTVAELGEMLPRYGVEYHKTIDITGRWSCGQSAPIMIIIKDDKEADARARMLIYLIENKLITV